MRALLSKLTDLGTPERCGIITKRGKVVELTNIHDEPTRGYRIDAAELLPYLEKGNIRATWHSHPGADANLSEEDYAGFANWPNLKHHIVGVRDGKPTVDTFAFDDGVLVKVSTCG